jgi:hypothetical protein
MSKVHRISADKEDRFEEDLEGVPENFGSIDDWETEAVLKMRKLMRGQSKGAGGDRDTADDAEELVNRKLALYKATLKLMNDNPKLAMQLGNKGGFNAISSYVLKQSIDYAAKKEIEPYARAIANFLPGTKVSAYVAAAKTGGFADADARKNAVKKHLDAKPAVIDL